MFDTHINNLGELLGMTRANIAACIQRGQFTEGVSWEKRGGNHRYFDVVAACWELHETTKGGTVNPYAASVIEEHPRPEKLDGVTTTPAKAKPTKPKRKRAKDADPKSDARRAEIEELLATYTSADADKLYKLSQWQVRELELEVKRGKLVEKADVYAALFDYAQKVRQRVEAVPARIVDDLLACRTRQEAMQILDEAIADALQELAGAGTTTPEI